ncbi:MAG: DUF58 domain-containing protein, partial [Ilumatobacteraceae bacterium]
ALLAAAGAFAVGRVFGLVELYVLCAGLVTAALIALIAVWRPIPNLVVRRIVHPALVSVGESARVDLQVTNVDGRRSPHLVLWEPVGTEGGAPMQIAALRPGEAADAAYRVPTARRGLLVAGPLRASRRDVLGLCVKSATLIGTEEVLVVPQHIHLPFPTIGSAGRLGQHLRLRAWGQTGGEFHSLREYAAGDDLRRINWKASARSQDLMVRETALEGLQRCTVVLDTERGAFDPSPGTEAFERAVSVAASVTMSASTAGIGTRLVSAGIDLRGPDVAANGLRWLATVEPSNEPMNYASLARGVHEGLGVVVLVTGSARSGAVTSARAGISPEDTLVVVTVNTGATADGTSDGDGGASRGRFVVDASSVDMLERSWTALVSGRNPVPV